MIKTVEFWRRSGKGYEMNIYLESGEIFQFWISADSLFFDALYFLEFSPFANKFRELFK